MGVGQSFALTKQIQSASTMQPENEGTPVDPPDLQRTNSSIIINGIQEKLGDDVTVKTVYGRVQFLGPSAVGKTSLRHGLMNKPLPTPTSTLIANTQQVKSQYGWTKTGGGETTYWKEVTEKQQDQELVKLLSQVHQLPSNPRKKYIIASLLQYPLAKPAVRLFAPIVRVADLVHRHNIKMKQVEEIVKEFKQKEFKEILQGAFDNAICNIDQQPCTAMSMCDSSVDPDILMNIWDCGGQSVFLDVLPAFLTSRTLFVLVFDASKDLNINWTDVVHTDNGHREEREEQTYTTLDLLTRWMASIHAHLTCNDRSHCALGYPRILIVGTHMDRPGVNPVEIRRVLEDRYKDKAFNQLILGIKFVDNTTAGTTINEDSVYQDIRDMTKEFASAKLAVDTPVSWVLFRKLLTQYRQKLNKPVIDLAEAIAIGHACCMEDEAVLSCLNFYHELGVLLYYAHITSLSGFVICDPQWLINQFALILSINSSSKRGTPENWRMLRTEGILTSALYEVVWENSSIQPQGLVELLEHFLLAVPIDRGRYTAGREYFVPSMLSLYIPTQESEQFVYGEYYQKAPSVFLIFNTGYVPPGYFVRLATALARRREFKILFRRGVHSNRLILDYGESDESTKINEVVIMEHLNSVEVTVVRRVPRDRSLSFHHTCRNILQNILLSSREALQWLPSIQVDPAFVCECTDTCPVTPIHTSCSKKASVSSLNSNTSCGSLRATTHYAPFTLDQFSDEYFRCTKLKYTLPSKEQGLWLIAAECRSTTKPCLSPLTNIQLLDLSHCLDNDKIHKVARALDMTAELAQIEEAYIFKNKAFHLLSLWNQKADDRDQLAEVLASVGLEEASRKVRIPETIPKLSKVPEAQTTTSTEPLSQSELDCVAQNIMENYMPSLAAKLDMLDEFYTLHKSTSILHPNLYLLQQWNQMMGNREDLTVALHETGLHKLAEKVRCNQLVKKAKVTVHPLAVPLESEHLDGKPEVFELIRCSRLITCQDLSYLAGALDICDQDVEELAHSYKNPMVQAMQLLKMWSANVNGSRRDLFHLLSSLGTDYYAAAQSLIEQSCKIPVEESNT